MSTPSMPKTKTSFADLPREIRDMIFLKIASAAELGLEYDDTCHLRLKQQYSVGKCEFTQCITTLHDWAPKSYIAKAACEVFWSYGTFRHSWDSHSDAIVDPQATLYIETDEEARKSVGTPIDLRECVQKVHLFTNSNPASYAEPRNDETQSLLKLKRELAQLHDFPHLRRVHIEICIAQERDAYFEGMIIVEAIAGACNELRARIGTGLTVMMYRAWHYLEEMDISWMWIPPSREEREWVEEGISTWDQYIRVHIADGVYPDAKYTLLEELRYAGEALPQEKDEILEMEAWEPWMGVSEAKFKNIKETWGREDEEPPAPPSPVW